MEGGLRNMDVKDEDKREKERKRADKIAFSGKCQLIARNAPQKI